MLKFRTTWNKRHTRIKIYDKRAHEKNELNVKRFNNSHYQNDLMDRTLKIAICNANLVD